MDLPTGLYDEVANREIAKLLQEVREEFSVPGATIPGGRAQPYLAELQEYEDGSKPIPAALLWGVSRVMGVPMGYFVPGLSGKPLSLEEAQLLDDFRILSGEQRAVMMVLSRQLADTPPITTL